MGILTVYDIYVLETVSYYVKKISCPISNSNVYNYNTRNSRHIEQHKVKFFEKKIKTNFISTKSVSKLQSNIKNLA